MITSELENPENQGLLDDMVHKYGKEGWKKVYDMTVSVNGLGSCIILLYHLDLICRLSYRLLLFVLEICLIFLVESSCRCLADMFTTVMLLLSIATLMLRPLKKLGFQRIDFASRSHSLALVHQHPFSSTRKEFAL